MMGGAGPVIAKGRELFDAGEHDLAREILNKLVHAEPQNREAKDLLADAFEQNGYQQESPSVRNSFLADAFRFLEDAGHSMGAGVIAPRIPPAVQEAVARCVCAYAAWSGTFRSGSALQRIEAAAGYVCRLERGRAGAVDRSNEGAKEDLG